MPTLLDWLLAAYPETPKTRAKQWIAAGRVRVNGVIIRQPNRPMPEPRGTLELLDRRAAALNCGPNGWPIHPLLALLHLDTALVVVNKGPGLLSTPAQLGDLSALGLIGDFVAGRLRTRYSVPAAYRRLQPLPVHRLDQFTSGVFCMAMNPRAREMLIDQLQTHAMKREYIAYVEGCPSQPTGTWRNWLKLSTDELRQLVAGKSSADAVEAITHYDVLAKFPSAGAAKLRLRLETGRKHQIRVQAAHAGIPLIGDHTYNPKGRIDFPRQALHAEVLSLEHPAIPRALSTWTATLPPDLRQLEAALQSAPR